MTNGELEYIKNTVISLEPRKILETGTRYGEGSSTALASGLYELGSGSLHTWEVYKPYYDIATNNFSNSVYKDIVYTYLGNFTEEVDKIPLEFFNDLDLILLDGSDETPEGNTTISSERWIESENVKIFSSLVKRINKSVYFLLHDWSVEGGRGSFVKMYLETINNKKDFTILNTLRVNPEDVGLALILYKNKEF